MQRSLLSYECYNLIKYNTSKFNNYSISGNEDERVNDKTFIRV